ncbi:MAG: hypothetical protein NC343_04575 [Muribaculum sp.]|nr:hypothetical protein [Muribaculaceae bacterium]MCM1081006.1 hypothetical protein [Muribaculum sp.]
MKVVQSLYSYLLTRNYFKIEQAPNDDASRDKRFAHTVYADLLIMLLDINGYAISFTAEGIPTIKPRTGKPNTNITRCAHALAASEPIKELIIKNRGFIEKYRSIAPEIEQEVKDSAIYKEYSRKRSAFPVADEVLMWQTVFQTIVLRNKKIIELLKSTNNFTIVGQEQGFEAWKNTLNDYASISDSLVEARKCLSDSLDKSYDLYHAMLQLIVDITRFRELQLDEAKHKYLPTADDLNPSTQFIDNRLAKLLSENEELEAYGHDHDISWANDVVLLRRLMNTILESETYKEYISKTNNNFVTDADFWHDILKYDIINSDDLADALEAKSVYWNDDIAIMGSFTLKTIHKFATSDNPESVHLLPKFKDEEDEKFGPKLFESVIANQDKYREIIDQRLTQSKWDPERLAFMDIIILETAIAELLNFESIPTLVTINEYTEIANYYSTPRSGQFITGMLYAIINALREQGLITKE